MSNREAVRRLLRLLSDYKGVILFIMGCLFLSAGFSLCLPILNRDVMDKGFIGGDKDALIFCVAAIFCCHLVNELLTLLKEKMRIDIYSKILYQLGVESYRHLLKMKIQYFDRKNDTEILNNINLDIGNMAAVADDSLFFVVTQVFSMVGGIAGLFLIDYRLTFLVLLFLPIKYFVMKFLSARREKVMVDYIEDSRKFAGWFGDSVGGMKEIRVFGACGRKLSEYSVNQKKVIAGQRRMNLLGQWNTSADTILLQFLMMVLYIIGADLVFSMQLSVGSIFAFINYSVYVTTPISAILNIKFLLSGILPSAKRHYQFMDLEEEEENSEGELPAPGDIVFQEVTFSYTPEREVLKGVTFQIPKGSKTALIGKNGSGKSTVIDLLLRMYEPQKGKILLGGRDISRFRMREYREMISVVSQQIYLFHDTIRNNITLYRQVRDDTIMEAVRDSGLEEFIREVSLDYIVGQNGMLLSGGQKQKIALARAMVQDRPILVFDEATSNTDVCSESQINGLVHTKFQSKTVIIVTHKQEILEDMNQIILLEDS